MRAEPTRAWLRSSPGRPHESVLGSKEDGLFVGAFDLDAVGLDAGIIFERVVHDSPIESVHWFKFDDVPPAAHFFGGLLCFAHESLAGLAR